MIPDEAVEAAHKAWHEQAALDGSIFEYNLRAALEAAAPHLMAKGWDQGAVAGGEHQHHIEKAKQAGVEAPGNIFNPYRVQP